MLLTVTDIDYIQYDLKKKGIADDSLFDELVDDVCCDVELKMKGGVAFKKAYEEVVKKIDPREWTDLQNKVILSENYNTPLMLKNTLKMMLRNMQRHRTHAAINILGLSLGLACFIVITLYLKHELGYDKMFDKHESIYRITASSSVGGKVNHIPTSFPAFGPEVVERFGDVKNYTRIFNYKYTRMVPTFRYDDKIFYEDKVIFADSSFFDLFNFQFLEGNPAKALSHPNSVVMTETAARKYFGENSPLGKNVKFNNLTELEVTGVLKDLPSNTHLQFDFVIPMSAMGGSGVFRSPKVLEGYNVDWFWTYFTIDNPAQVAIVEAGLNKIATDRIPDFQKEYDAKFYLQPLDKIHLYSEFDYNTDISPNGDIKSFYIFISVGILVLIISAINFINLTMATASRRYKEIGIGKVLGALKSQLRMQFIFESIAVCMISLLIGFFMLQALLPLFSNLLGVSLTLTFQENIGLIGGIVLFTALVGVTAGAYPAFFVASFEPQRVLKGVWKPGEGGASFRKILVGAQISISIFLIIGTIVIYEQLQFIQNKSLGYDKDQVIMLTIRGTALVKSYHAFKENLLSQNSIVSVSSVSEPVGREVQFMDFTVEGQEKPQFVKILNVTHDFVKTMGLEIVKGRDYSREHSTDSISGFLVNEAFVKTYGWDEPVGKALDHTFRKVKEGTVIGVVKDFNFEPLQKQIDPIIIWFGSPNWYAAVKIQKGKTNEALAAIEAEWKKFESEKPVAFHFLDQSIDKVYEGEKRLSNVFMIFSLFSIFTAVLGLYGLISFIAEQRLAEIGIRKVMGASVNNILYLISREYVYLVVIAFVLSAPLTYLIVDRWLQSFAFRIPWNPVFFALGFILSGGIVITTVSLKALKAAQSNPVDTLKYE
ncbi:MAG: FtsX-like permease family protein [Cyclobacteriaceae bacterium]|nr:FtsX-like permease family protein [Cyclobacteriaceae bacterium]